MFRIATFVLAAALSAFAVPALAEPAHPAESARKEGAEKKFPMPAAEFRAHVATRQEKARARMEEHAARLPKDQADEARARFAAALTEINAKVDAVCADGTVTKEEAHEVKALTKSLLHHHHKEVPT